MKLNSSRFGSCVYTTANFISTFLGFPPLITLHALLHRYLIIQNSQYANTVSKIVDDKPVFSIGNQVSSNILDCFFLKKVPMSLSPLCFLQDLTSLSNTETIDACCTHRKVKNWYIYTGYIQGIFYMQTGPDTYISVTQFW